MLFMGIAGITFAQLPVVRVFHPTGPLPSYEVTTIKPSDPAKPYAGTNMRRYISSAYGVPIPWGVPGAEFSGSQVVGGPAWIDGDKYDIVGKAPDELRAALEKMSVEKSAAQTRMMQQSLLADRFHLKVHFGTREMPIFELVPAKGGLKIKPAEPPPVEGSEMPLKPGELAPGSAGLAVRLNGVSTLNARATSMELFANALRGQSPDVGGRPIVDMTGFQGTFDVKDFRFFGVVPPQGGGATGTNSDPDMPSLFQALEEKLGLKLIPARAQVEVVVIDSIERPSQN